MLSNVERAMIRSSYFTQEKLIRYALILSVLLLAISFPFHRMNVDEAWSAEQSFTMSKQGYSTSNLFRGMDGGEHYIVVQHKLFIYIGSLLFSVLGYDLMVFRIIPIISLLLLVWCIYYYCKSKQNLDNKVLYTTVVFLLLMPQFFYFSTIARPEMLVTLFGLASFVALTKYVELNNMYWVAFSGGLAGLAMLSHLNGCIFIATGVAMLLLKRRYLGSLVFALSAILCFTPYLVDIYQHTELFKLQISSPLIASKTKLSITFPFVNLLHEHKRLFRKPDIILPILVFMFSVLHSWKWHRANHALALTYTLLLLCFFGALVEDKTIKYSVYLSPFMALIIAPWLVSKVTPLHSLHKLSKYSFVLLVTAFIGFGFYRQVEETLDKVEYTQLNREIASYIPKHSVCVAPMNFIFNELPNYTILSNYLVRYEVNGPITIEQTAAFCKKKHCTYLLYNMHGERMDDIQDFGNTELLNHYFTTITHNAKYTILKYKGVQ